MKTKYSLVRVRASRRRFIPSILAAAIAMALAVKPSNAALAYWDSNGATAGAGVTPTGTWGTSNFWSTSSAGTAATAAYTAGSDAVFSAGTDATGSPTITVSGARTAASLAVEEGGTLTFAGAATPSLAIGAGGITVAAGPVVTFNNTLPVTLSAAQSWTKAGSNTLTVAGTLGLGANALTKAGAGNVTATGVVSGTTAAGSTAISVTSGVLTLSGANTFRGNIAVAGSSAVFAMPGATYTATAPYGASGTANVYKQLLLTDGGTFQLTSGTFNNNGTSTNQAGGIIFNIGTGGGVLDIVSGATLIIDDGSGTGTGGAASQLQGSGNLTKSGLGTFSFDDSTGYAGTITVTAGSIQPASANAFGANTAGTTIQSGAQMNLNGVTMTNTEPLTINGTGLTATPIGALTNSSATGATWAGALSVASDSHIGGNSGSITVNGVISGSGALSKVGTNTVRVVGNSASYAAGMSVLAGTLEIGTSANAAGTGTIQLGDTTGSANATLTCISSVTHANAITVRAGSTGTKTLALTAAPATIFSGLITMNDHLTVSNTGTGTLTTGTTGNSINLNSNTLTIANTSSGRYFADGVIYGGGSVVMNSSGSGDYVPRGDFTYSGGTTITTGAIAVDRDSIGTPGSPTSGPFGTGTIVINGGQMRSGTGPVAGRFVGNAVTVGGNFTFYGVSGERDLTFTGPVTLSGSSRTITSTVGTFVPGKAALLSGAIGDGGNNLGLTKAGVGNLVLAGANTYSGATTVNDGLLVLRGSIAPSSAVTVSPSVAAGAVLSLASGNANPVNSTAALTIDSTVGPATIGLDLGANTAGSDSINTTSAATTTGTVNLAIQALSGFGTSSSYNLLTAASGLNGATYSLSSAPGGYSYSITSSATSVQLGVTPTTAGDIYWRGDTNTSWSAFSGTNSNWYANNTGTTNAQANPGAGDTVIFSTTNAALNAGAVNTVLNNHYTVNDVVFGSNPVGVSAVNIAGGITPSGAVGILTLAPSSSADGLNVGDNAGNATISAPVSVGANQTWTVAGTGANGSTLTVTGPLSGSAALAIVGTVNLNSAAAASTYSGTLTVPSGSILQGGVANSFSTAMGVAVNGTGIVRLNGVNNNIGALTGNGIVENNHASTGATLTVGDATDFTFTGTIRNGAAGTLALTKTGTGKFIINSTNTYTGTTTVNAGTLAFGSATSLTSANAVTLSGTGTLDLNGFDQTVGTFTSAATNFITNNAAGTGTNTLTISAAGPTLSALITDGATAKTALRVNNSNANNFITANNTLNTFSGGLILANNANGTRLSINAAVTGTPWGTGAITVGETSTDKAGIYFSAAPNTLSLPIILNTSLGTDRYGIRNDGQPITLSGQITANVDAVFSSNSSTASNTNITNKITGAGGFAIDLSQTNIANTVHTVTLSTAANANDYQGDTIVGRTLAAPAQNYTATLALGAADQIPNGAGKGNLIINNNSGTRIGFVSLAGYSDTINGLSGNGTLDSTTGSSMLTLGDKDTTATFSGVLQNTGGSTLNITKIGTGTQTFSGASTFTGSLTVNAGFVAFSSSPATSGPLGNTSVVNLSGGGISYTGITANNLNRSVDIGAANGTLNATSSVGALTISSVTSSGGDLVKTGPGTVIISGTTTLNGGAADVEVDAGTLQAGFGSAGVATISVGAAGNYDQRNAATEALVLDGTVGALTLDGGAQLGFDLNGATNDSITVDAGGTASTSGTVTLNFYGTPSAGTYTLLTAPSGLNSASYVLGAAPNGFNYTINATSTSVTLDVQPFTPIYWRGGQNLSWSTLGSGSANWTTDAGGGTDATSTPLATDAVLFSAAGAPMSGNAIATTLDGAFIVDSLQFTNVPSGITAVTISAGSSGSLTLSPVSTSGGIRVLSGAGTNTIDAPLTVGASQTWDVDSTGTLVVSGVTVFNANVNKTNSGALTLSGSNTGTATFTLSGGTLNLNHDAALGSGTFAIGAGTIINSPLAARTLSTNNVQSWNGDYTFTGTNNLGLGTGAVTINNSIVTVTTTANTLTVGGVIGDGGNNRILGKAGAGTLELNGANTYGGGVNLNAGTLLLGNNGALGTGTLRINGAATVASNTAVVTSNNVQANSNFTVGGTNALTLGNIALDANRTITNTNTTALTTIAGITGTTTNITFSGDGNTTVPGAINITTGIVTKNGAGTLTLAGTNTYTGNTAVSAGTVAVTGSVSPGTAAITVGSGSVGTLSVANGGSISSTGALNLGSGTTGNNFVVNTGGTVVVGSINNPWATNYTVDGMLTSAGTWSVSTNFTTSTFNGAGTISAPALTFGNATTGVNYTGSGTINIAGNVTVASNSGAGAPFYTQSSGTLNANAILLGDNTTNSSGSRTFNLNGGRVNLGSGGIAATGTTAATKVVNLGAATLGARADWSSSLNAALTSATPGVTVDTLDSVDNTTARNITLSGVLSGSGKLTKAGLGVLTLSGANTYTGPTEVTGGKLQLNGSAATNPASDVTIGALGSLGFTASSASTMNLTGKDLTLSGGTLAFDIGNTGVNDTINVDDLILTANSALSFTGIGAIDGTYTLITSTNPITNSGSFTLSGQTVGRVTLTPTINANTVTVTSSVSEGKWNFAGGGNWSNGDPNATAGNWLGYKPTVDGDAALFGDSITAASTILVDTPHTTSFMRFDNANSYTIGATGGNNLTLGNSIGAALISTVTGSHTIAENMALTSNLSVLPALGTALTLSGSTSGSGRNISVNGSGDVTISGAISTTTGTVTKNGAGALTLSAANSYLGNTEVVGGTLNVTGSLTGNGTATTGPDLLYGTAAGNSIVNVSGDIVDYRRFLGSTHASANAAYIQTGGDVNFTSTQTGNPTNSVAAAGYGYMEITGGNLVAKGRFAPSNGAGSTGVMYIGGTGTLDHSAGEWFLMTYSPSGDGGKAMITLDNGGTLNRVGASNTFGLNMDRSNGYAVLNIAGGQSLNSNRPISFGNGTGSGITNTTGILNLAAGTLQIGANMANGNTSGTGNKAYLNFAGGTLLAQAAMNNAIPVTAANQTFTSTIFGAIDNVGSAHDFTGGLVVDSNTFAVVLANNLVAPSASGVAQSSLTITGGTGYIGAPMVEFTGGTLAAGGSPASGYAVVSGGAVTQIVITSPGSYDIAPSVTLTGGGGTGASVTVGSLVANSSGGLTKLGAGVLALSGANTYTGATLISGGTLQIGNAGTTGSISLSSTITNNSVFAVNRTDTVTQGTQFGPISGTGSFNQAGAGTTILNTTNAYAGGSTITAGILQANHNDALGTGTVAVNGGVRLAVNAGVDLANAVTLGANTGTTGRGLIESVGSSGTAIVSGPITITTGAAAGGHFNAAVGTVLELKGLITSTLLDGPTGKTVLAHRNGRVMFSGGGSGYQLLNNGEGTTIVGANNGIATTATVNLGASAAGNLDLNGFNQSLDGITKGANAGIIGNSSTTADSVLTTTGTSTFAGVIQDVIGSGTRKVSLSVPSGTLTLSAANTYTGDTSVTGGTLLVTGSIASSANVSSSGVLGGNGTVGATTVATTGIVSPGNASVATLNFSSSLTLNSGSEYAVGITAAATNDRVNVTGAFTANGTIKVTLSGYTPVLNDTFDIANAGSTTGTPTFDFSGATLSFGLKWETRWC